MTVAWEPHRFLPQSNESTMATFMCINRIGRWTVDRNIDEPWHPLKASPPDTSDRRKDDGVPDVPLLDTNIRDRYTCYVVERRVIPVEME